MAESDTPRIVIAGGGVAGLEACLALRSFLGGGDLRIDLLCRHHVFEYRPLAMWWPPSKIAGRHLAPYLAIRCGAPRAPEVRPEHDALPITVDIPRAVDAVSSALDPSAVPPV